MNKSFAKLGKLSLALLEHFVEDKLGKKFVDELRAPTDRTLAVVTALEQAQERFLKEFEDKTFSADVLSKVSELSLSLLSEAVGKYYDHPTDPGFPTALRRLIHTDFPYFPVDRVENGVTEYITILTEELVLADPIFRQNASALAIVRSEKWQKQLLGALREHQSAEVPQVLTTLFTIPLPVQDFTGRERELEQLGSELERGVVITGISGGGGFGKTELARKLADELKDDYPDARMNIDLLGTLETPLTLEEAMRRLLEPFYPNKRLPDDSNQLKGLYQQTFSTRKVLLLLDNAASANQVRSLIPPSPSAAIVTSRQYFSLTEFGLKEPLRLEELSIGESRDMLRNASSKLSESTELEVDELADLCGRLPLALRVAVSLLNDRTDWTVNILVQRLVDERTRLRRLKRPDDIDLDVEATISLSYNLLPDKIQRRFRMLGVFVNFFWAHSVAMVWGSEDEEEVDASLGVLVTRNLLNSQPVPFGVVGKSEIRIMSYYTLHDLTWLFALDRLRENREELKEAVERHAYYFLALSGLAEEEYQKGHDQISMAVNIFHSIWFDLFAAWNRLQADQGDWPHPPEADIWISMFPNRCAHMLMLLMPPRERIRIYDVALEYSRQLGDRLNEGTSLANLGTAYNHLGETKRSIELYKQALPIADEVDHPLLKANVIASLGAAYITLNTIDKAIDLFQQALVIYDEIGDTVGKGGTLTNLGSAYSVSGDIPRAIEFYEKGLLISQETGNRSLEAASLNNLGRVHTDLGEVNTAISFHERALEITKEISDKYGQGLVLGAMGTAFSRLGEFSTAIGFYEKHLIIMREAGDRRGEGEALANLGSTYGDQGDVHKAIELYEQGLAIAREIGNRPNEEAVLGYLGNMYYSLPDAHNAIKYYQQALLVSQETENRRGEAVAFNSLGNAYVILEDLYTAIGFYERALAIDREIGDSKWLGADFGYLARVYAKLGDARKAIEFYEQELAMKRKIGDYLGEGRALADLGMAHKHLGEIDKAKQLLQEALAIFRNTESSYVKTVEEWIDEINRSEEAINEDNVQQFIRDAFNAMRTKSSQAAQYFTTASRLAQDSDVSLEFQELGKVLHRILAGVKKPDLSRLSGELANLIKDELEK